MLDPNPVTRISAGEGLNHLFVVAESTSFGELITSQNLRNYEVDFLTHVRPKNQSEDMNGSLALHTGGLPAMNGLTDTVGSLTTYSNPTLSKGGIPPPLSSKFSKPRAESIDVTALNAANFE